MEPIQQRHNNTWKIRKRARQRRIILIGLLAIYALMGWLRLEGAFTYLEYFISIGLIPGPTYFAITGGLIGFAFSIAILLFIFKNPLAGRYARWLGIIFLIWFWIDRIWFSTRDAFFFQLETSVLITMVTLFWAFVLIRKKDLLEKTDARTDKKTRPQQPGQPEPEIMQEDVKEEYGE